MAGSFILINTLHKVLQEIGEAIKEIKEHV
jgi:hypothetical protein